MRLPDQVTGLFLIALGAAAAYGGSRLPPVPGQPVGPNVFPIVVGVGLCLCGTLIACGIGRRFENEAEADLAIIGGAKDAPSERGALFGLRVLIPPALLLFYFAAVDRLGFIATAAIVVFIAALALGAKLRLALPLAVLAPIAVHLVFSRLLRVPLPAGLVPMPW
jgi:putative tricarboxylic transport membrane protein